jgi:hypothetical protein
VRLSHSTGGRCRIDRIKITDENFLADHKGVRVKRQSKTVFGLEGVDATDAIENGRSSLVEGSKLVVLGMIESLLIRPHFVFILPKAVEEVTDTVV